MNAWEERMLKYLRDRGISSEYASHAGVRAISSDTAHRMGYPYAQRSQGGIVYPYFGPIKRKGLPSLTRVRYLGKLPCDSGGKEIRYTQPSESIVEAFFDLNVNWMEVFANPRIPIAITEGEAKALFMNQHRRELGQTVTIALGGVWNFREKASGDLTPWLRMVRASSCGTGRKFIIAFDSDMADNSGIRAAAAKLSELLSIDVDTEASV